MHPHTRGRLAEGIALFIYLCLGFRPVRAPYRLRTQIDLLLRRRHLLLLVEVKYRSHNAYAAAAVGPAQHARLAVQMHRLAGTFPQCTLAVEILTLTPVWPFVTRRRVLDAALPPRLP